jgi:uncharacterized membrane protein
MKWMAVGISRLMTLTMQVRVMIMVMIAALVVTVNNTYMLVKLSWRINATKFSGAIGHVDVRLKTNGSETICLHQ